MNPSADHRSMLFAIGTCLAIGGCEAHTEVRTPIQLGAFAQPERGRLHIQVTRAASFAAPLGVATCGPFQQDALIGRLEATPGGFTLVQDAIPTVPEFCVAAWYDADGDGTLNTGDGTGQLPMPYPAQPSGFFSSNVYFSPTLSVGVVP